MIAADVLALAAVALLALDGLLLCAAVALLAWLVRQRRREAPVLLVSRDPRLRR